MYGRVRAGDGAMVIGADGAMRWRLVVIVGDDARG